MAAATRSLALAALGALAMGTGCYKNTYITGEPHGGGVYTQKASFFIFGLVGQKTVDIQQVCPNGVSWFQNRMDFVDGLIGCVTCSLYTPVTIEVRCSSGQSYLAVPDAREGVTWIHPLDEDGQLPEDIELPEDVELYNGELTGGAL